MVLYTPLNYDDIFPTEIAPDKLVSYEGKSLYVREDETGNYELVRIISTDPQDFLNPNFYPGTKWTRTIFF